MRIPMRIPMRTPRRSPESGAANDAEVAAFLDGDASYYLTVDLPEDFALDQPLSPFMLAALELLDPESETYALDVISMAEATLEDPKQILRAQERQARDRAMNEMEGRGHRLRGARGEAAGYHLSQTPGRHACRGL